MYPKDADILYRRFICLYRQDKPENKLPLRRINIYIPPDSKKGGLNHVMGRHICCLFIYKTIKNRSSPDAAERKQIMRIEKTYTKSIGDDRIGYRQILTGESAIEVIAKDATTDDSEYTGVYLAIVKALVHSISTTLPGISVEPTKEGGVIFTRNIGNRLYESNYRRCA